MDTCPWYNNSEVSYSHVQATSHYHSNRFSLAADAFSNTLNALVINNDNDSHQIPTSPSTSPSRTSPKAVGVNHAKSISNDILSVLSRTALEADRALCLLRSSLQQSQSKKSWNENDMNVTSASAPTSTSTSTSTSLLLHARKANEEHAGVLEGVVSSLDQYDDGNENDDDRLYVVSRIRIDVSLALLMTGVSSLWLYLHSTRDEAMDKDPRTQRYGLINNKEYAKYIICKAIRLAGCCFLNRKGSSGEASYCTPTWAESLSIMHWLLLRNESTKISMNKEDNSILFNERDRIAEAFSSIKHALLIVDLSMCTNTNPSLKERSFIQEIPSNCGLNMTHGNHISKKRKRADSSCIDINLGSQSGTMNSPSQKAKFDIDVSCIYNGDSNNEDSNNEVSTRIANEHDNEDELSTHEIQQLLTKVLWHHLQLQYHVSKITNPLQIDFHHQRRDILMKRVLKFDRSSVSKSVSLFTAVLDILMNEPLQNTPKKWESIVLKLEAAMPSSSHLISLLGCIYTTQFGDPAKGLTLFQKALQIQKNEDDNNQVASILSNMSSCYAMLGHPKPVVELLIHKATLTLSTKSDFNSNLIDTMKVTLHEGMQTPHNDTCDSSTLWRIYFSSSLTKDWDTCSQSIQHLHKMNPSYCTFICSMFAKLEMDKPMDASKMYADSKKFNDFFHNHQYCAAEKILSIPLNIFHADAIIHSQISSTKKGEYTRDDIDASQITKLTSITLGLIGKVCSTQKTVNSNQLLYYLEACILNNHAFGLVMDGKNLEALSFFSKAVYLMKNASGLMKLDGYYFLHPLCNVVILLLKEGYCKEAFSIWTNATEFSNENKCIITRNASSNAVKTQFLLLDEIIHSVNIPDQV